MTSPQCLPFLRPYAFRPLATHNRAYLRLFELAGRHGKPVARGVSTSVKEKGGKKLPKKAGKTVVKKDGKEEAGVEYEPQNNSAFITQRIKELSAANALQWPRVERRAPSISVQQLKRDNTKVADVPKEASAEKNSGEINIESEAQKTFTMHGRLMSVRRSSAKLMFLDLVNQFDDFQAMVDLSKLEDETSPEELKAFSRLIKRGDHVSVVGRRSRSPNGDYRIELTQLPILLSPSLVPIPQKLANEDTRMQHRHMDMLVNKSTVDIIRMRSNIIHRIRTMVKEQLGCVEVQTPILAGNAGGAIARPFVTQATEFPQKDLALRIAPELWLKRLVAGGMDRVFEIGPAFRNEGLDATHNPEFTTCEYYIAYATLDDLISNTEQLMCALSLHCQALWRRTIRSPQPDLYFKQFKGPFERLEFVPALQEALGFELPDLTSDSAASEILLSLECYNSRHNHKDLASLSLPKLLDRLAARYLEPNSEKKPIFITHHPACMSPLAKSFTCPTTNQLVSARAELFVHGREMANMYEEENDPFAQRRKMVEQAKYRDQRSSGDDEEPPHPIDESYISVLESGLPPTGGWGCGIDRLVMLFTGAKRISDVLPFGSLRNVVGLSAVKPAKKVVGLSAVKPAKKVVPRHIYVH